MTRSKDWDRKERWQSHKIWSYLALLDTDRLFHTKSRVPRIFGNMMFYSGIFHTVYIATYYLEWLIYYLTPRGI